MVNYRKTGGLLQYQSPYSIIACCNYIAAVLSYFIVFTDPSNLPWITPLAPFTGWYSSMLPSQDHGPFNRCLRYVNAFCDRTTGYFLLIVNKKLRAKYKKLSKERA